MSKKVERKLQKIEKAEKKLQWSPVVKQGYRQFLLLFMVIAVLGCAVCQWVRYQQAIPAKIQLRKGKQEAFSLNVPCLATVTHKQGSQKVDLKKPFSLQADREGNYEMKVALFGILPMKKIAVCAASESRVIPGGEPVGIYVETDGVMVLGTTTVTTREGKTIYPAENIIIPGDYITAVNGRKIHYKSQFLDFLAKNKSKDFVLTLRRNGNLLKVRITPYETREGNYRCGIWIRDDTQGIGTVTYENEKQEFGALGHGISDVDTGKLLQTRNGRIYRADIYEVLKGRKGKPGELMGSIDYASTNIIGKINRNTSCGIFGKYNRNRQKNDSERALPVGLKQDIRKGRACIRSCVNGKMQEYEVEIQKVNVADTGNKGIILKVTDKELLRLTGGIVQGMSGSPIIQNGRVIGAVTHVFVNDPTKGYGIFLENMLAHQQSLQ